MTEPLQHIESPEEKTNWWAEVRAAVAGNQQSFTEGKLGKAIFLLAVPMVLEMFMQAVFEVVDVFFVGKLGANAVAAVGITASVLVLVFAIGIGLAMAATAMVARRYGEGDHDGAARAAVQSIILCIIVSVPIGIAGWVYAEELLRLMGAADEVVIVGIPYFRIMFATNIVILLLFLINSVFRGTGDAVFAMRALWLANILNIILDPLLIFGFAFIPAMGVTGAAIATVIGRGIGVLYQIKLLTGGRGRITIRREHIAFRSSVMEALLRVSGPGVLQYLVGTASWMGIMRILTEFGSAVVAGYTIAVRVIVFALLPSWGIGNAAATLVGQNLGAEKPDRAEKSVWITGWVNTAFLSVFGVALWILAEPTLKIFTDEPDVIKAGAECLKIVAYSYPFFGFGMVVVQAFNGAGDTWTPTKINFFSFWILQIPLALWFGFKLGFGPNGVYAGIAIAQASLAIVGGLWFKQGTWKTKMI